MNKMFENKIAVVTGAGGTLCSEIAIQLSLEGAIVFLVGRGGRLGSIPGLGRSPGEGNNNPLQYSCLENPTDGGAW